jgi:hypothetical protein
VKLGLARYARTALRVILSFASAQLIPVKILFFSSRTKARIANPMWLRCARAERTCARSTAQYCFSPRWYCSIAQAMLAYLRRVDSDISKSHVAQCCASSVSPFVGTIRVTRTKP